MDRFALPALIVILGLAGCGGSSGNGGGSGPKAAYLTRAEAACTKANTDLAALKKAPPASVAEVPPYVHKIVDVARGTVTQLSALSLPPADAAALKSKLLDPLGVQLQAGDAYAAKVDAAAKSKDQAGLLQLVTHPPTQTRVDLAFLKSYGFKACVQAADTANASR